MAGFLFRLETVDGVAAEPPTLATSVPNWEKGNEIPLGKRTLRVVGMRDDDADRPPVLIVEEAWRQERGSVATATASASGSRFATTK